MTWTTDSREHIRHIRDLEQMLGSSARREYSPDTEPPGFVEYWDRYFAELYIVGCLMYLEKVFGMDSHWLKVANVQNSYPDLFRVMESLRCVRNCIIHNAGKINPQKPNGETIIRQFDIDVRSGTIFDEVKIEKSNTQNQHLIRPYYALEPDGTINVIPNLSMVRWYTVAYLWAEGKLQTV